MYRDSVYAHLSLENNFSLSPKRVLELENSKLRNILLTTIKDTDDHGFN